MSKQILIVVFGLFLAGAACSAMEETMVTALFNDYISAQEALAADDLEQAKQALTALSKESDPQVSEVALAAAEAEDLTGIRVKFKALSEQIEALPLPKGYVVAFCPMADEGNGATWVQKAGEIKNPYFGNEMQGCGEVKKGVE